MEFASRRADQLGEAALDGSVDILVGGDEEKLSAGEFFFNGSKPKGDGGVLFIRKNICLVQGVCPRETPIHILNRHALIDRQGSVERPCEVIEFL